MPVLGFRLDLQSEKQRPRLSGQRERYRIKNYRETVSESDREREGKERGERERNTSFINTPAAAMHAGHECVSPESLSPHHY